MPDTKAITVAMSKDRETKGTFVYSAKVDTDAVRTIYIQKGAEGVAELGDEITLTIS